MTNTEILKVIKKARNYSKINDAHENYYMCHGFNHAFGFKWKYNGEALIEAIQKIIPEFNREFCEATSPQDSICWFLEMSFEPRLKAYNKLIACYEEKIKNEG